MRVSREIATSVPLKRGDVTMKLTVESMKQSLTQLEGVPIIHDHDPLCLPLGKTERAWVEYAADGEGLLYNEQYLVYEEPERFIHELSKVPCVRIPFADSPKRWVVSEHVGPLVELDISAIRGDVVRQLHGDIYAFDEHMAIHFHDQREELPITLIRFVADMSLAETLLTSIKLAILSAAITGKLTAWTSSTVAWVGGTCLPVLRKIRDSRTNAAKVRGFEWLVLAFNTKTSGGLAIELVIPSAQDSEIPEAAIEAFAETLVLFADVVTEADKAVFVYDAVSGQCDFRYALTKEGGVIGTEACYEEVIPRHERTLAVEEAGTHVFGRLVTVENDEKAIQLYSLNEPPQSLGYVSLSQDTAATLLEWWGEDADILHPMHFERQSGDDEGVTFRMSSTPKAKTTDERGDTS